ncbi:MAG TPA: hypothetical protein HPP77_09985, partial [Candidatus Hydrogenedentes bacterium]|nr:hypothetical protein [Candidatus Hydrogenedentota bacterium]
RFAPGMVYFRKTKTPNDFFVAGDSGAGYINPGHLEEPRRFSGLPSGVETWARHCRKFYGRWDLSITGFIIDGFAPAMSEQTLRAYATFSQDGIVAQKIAPGGVFEGMPFVRMNLDLGGTPAEAAEQALSRLGPTVPDFQIFRTILWRPSALKELYEAMETQGANVEIVDPFTFFLLVKQHYGGESR